MYDFIVKLLKDNFIEKFNKILLKENINKISLVAEEIEDFLNFIATSYFLENKKIGFMTKIPYRCLGFPNVKQISTSDREKFEIIFFDDTVDSNEVDFSLAEIYFYYGNKNLGFAVCSITNNIIKVVDEYLEFLLIPSVFGRIIINSMLDFSEQVFNVLGYFAVYDKDTKKVVWNYGGKSNLVKLLLGKQTKLAGGVSTKLNKAITEIENSIRLN